MKMNKLEEIQLKKNLKRMRKAAEESQRALTVLINTMMGDSDYFSDDDIDTVETIHRFTKDMDKFLGALESQIGRK